MDKTHQELRQYDKNDDSVMLVITAQELKSKLASNEPLMVFDIGNRERYEKQHIPGSACAVCNDDTKKSIMPRLPKNIELVIVSDDDEYPRQVAEMMQIMGLKARYLQGGIRSWQWDMKRSESDRNISPGELKEILDTEDYGLSDNGRTETAKSGTPLPLLPPAPFLLDVRERDEFRQWSIEGSTNIPLSELLSKRDLHDNIPKDKKIITICPHGNRSTIAKYFLERYGYNVSSLEGGLNAWSSTLEDVYKEIDISSTSNDNNNEILKLVQIRRIGKGCISYILGSKGEAAVIDPFYPVRYYINKASEIGVKITKVFDTHQHADHISAAKELAEMTGAIWYQSHYEQDQLSFSDEKKSAFPLIPKFSPLYDGDIHKIGGSIFRVIHTPGHTNGSISLLVKGYEQNNDTSSADGHHYFGKSLLLFTGDTLFVNGVGRPDLRDNAKEFAAMLYGTLHDRILPIGDNYNNGYNNNIFILPGHFDKNARAGELLSTTLGKVIEDVGLLNLPREEFIDKISSQVMPTPPNYRQIILINKGDIPILDSSQLHEIEMGPNRCSISGVA